MSQSYRCDLYPQNQLILLYDDINPKVRSVRLLINKLKLNLKTQYVNLIKGEHLTEAFKKINPASTVPTLIDGDLVLYNAPSIMVHLTYQYGGYWAEKLYPKNLYKQMKIMNILFFDLSVLYRCHGAYMAALIREKKPDKIHEYYGEKILESYKILEELLSKQRFIALDTLTIADYMVLGTISGLDLIYPLETYCAQFPKLHYWYSEMKRTSEFNDDIIAGVKRERCFIEKFSHLVPRISIYGAQMPKIPKDTFGEEFLIKNFYNKLWKSSLDSCGIENQSPYIILNANEVLIANNLNIYKEKASQLEESLAKKGSNIRDNKKADSNLKNTSLSAKNSKFNAKFSPISIEKENMECLNTPDCNCCSCRQVDDDMLSVKTFVCLPSSQENLNGSLELSQLKRSNFSRQMEKIKFNIECCCSNVNYSEIKSEAPNNFQLQNRKQCCSASCSARNNFNNQQTYENDLVTKNLSDSISNGREDLECCMPVSDKNNANESCWEDVEKNYSLYNYSNTTVFKTSNVSLEHQLQNFSRSLLNLGSSKMNLPVRKDNEMFNLEKDVDFLKFSELYSHSFYQNNKCNISTKIDHVVSGPYNEKVGENRWYYDMPVKGFRKNIQCMKSNFLDQMTVTGECPNEECRSFQCNDASNYYSPTCFENLNISESWISNKSLPNSMFCKEFINSPLLYFFKNDANNFMESLDENFVLKDVNSATNSLRSNFHLNTVKSKDHNMRKCKKNSKDIKKSKVNSTKLNKNICRDQSKIPKNIFLKQSNLKLYLKNRKSFDIAQRGPASNIYKSRNSICKHRKLEVIKSDKTFLASKQTFPRFSEDSFGNFKVINSEERISTMVSKNESYSKNIKDECVKHISGNLDINGFNKICLCVNCKQQLENQLDDSFFRTYRKNPERLSNLQAVLKDSGPLHEQKFSIDLKVQLTSLQLVDANLYEYKVYIMNNLKKYFDFGLNRKISKLIFILRFLTLYIADKTSMSIFWKWSSIRFCNTLNRKKDNNRNYVKFLKKRNYNIVKKLSLKTCNGDAIKIIPKIKLSFMSYLHLCEKYCVNGPQREFGGMEMVSAISDISDTSDGFREMEEIKRYKKVSSKTNFGFNSVVTKITCSYCGMEDVKEILIDDYEPKNFDLLQCIVSKKNVPYYLKKDCLCLNCGKKIDRRKQIREAKEKVFISELEKTSENKDLVVIYRNSSILENESSVNKMKSELSKGMPIKTKAEKSCVEKISRSFQNLCRANFCSKFNNNMEKNSLVDIKHLQFKCPKRRKLTFWDMKQITENMKKEFYYGKQFQKISRRRNNILSPNPRNVLIPQNCNTKHSDGSHIQYNYGRNCEGLEGIFKEMGNTNFEKEKKHKISNKSRLGSRNSRLLSELLRMSSSKIVFKKYPKNFKHFNVYTKDKVNALKKNWFSFDSNSTNNADRSRKYNNIDLNCERYLDGSNSNMENSSRIKKSSVPKDARPSTHSHCSKNSTSHKIFKYPTEYCKKGEEKASYEKNAFYFSNKEFDRLRDTFGSDFQINTQILHKSGNRKTNEKRNNCNIITASTPNQRSCISRNSYNSSVSEIPPEEGSQLPVGKYEIYETCNAACDTYTCPSWLFDELFERQRKKKKKCCASTYKIRRDEYTRHDRYNSLSDQYRTEMICPDEINMNYKQNWDSDSKKNFNLYARQTLGRNQDAMMDFVPPEQNRSQYPQPCQSARMEHRIASKSIRPKPTRRYLVKNVDNRDETNRCKEMHVKKKQKDYTASCSHPCIYANGRFLIDRNNRGRDDLCDDSLNGKKKIQGPRHTMKIVPKLPDQFSRNVPKYRNRQSQVIDRKKLKQKEDSCCAKPCIYVKRCCNLKSFREERRR